MARVLAKFIWFQMTTFKFVVLMSSANFTIIYDQIFHENVTVFQQEENTRMNLIEVNSQFDHLNNITTGLKNVSKDNVVLLFTKNDGFFEKNLQNQHLVLKYGLSEVNMVSMDIYSEC